MVKENTLKRTLPLSVEDLHRIVHLDSGFQKRFQEERGDTQEPKQLSLVFMSLRSLAL